MFFAKPYWDALIVIAVIVLMYFLAEIVTDVLIARGVIAP